MTTENINAKITHNKLSILYPDQKVGDGTCKEIIHCLGAGWGFVDEDAVWLQTMVVVTVAVAVMKMCFWGVFVVYILT